MSGQNSGPAPDDWWGHLQEDLGDSPPDFSLTKQRQARRALLHGESMTSLEFAKRFDASTSGLWLAMRPLKLMGFKFAASDEFIAVNGRQRRVVRYRIANLDYRPTEAHVYRVQEKFLAEQRAAATEARNRKAGKTVAVERVEPEPPPDVISRSNGTHRELEPMPQLDEALVVYALARNDDGSLTVGLRNGDRRFLTTLNGALE